MPLVMLTKNMKKFFGLQYTLIIRIKLVINVTYETVPIKIHINTLKTTKLQNKDTVITYH